MEWQRAVSANRSKIAAIDISMQMEETCEVDDHRRRLAVARLPRVQ